MKLDEAERGLHQARRILAQPHSYHPDEWMLLATLVGEADLAVRGDPLSPPALTTLLEQVVGELRDVTKGFTDPDFLRGSRAARRRNKDLFSSTT